VSLSSNDRKSAAEPRQRAEVTISPLVLSIALHLSPNTRMHRHPFKDRCVMCELLIVEAVSLYEAARRGCEQVKPLCCPFNLYQWISLSGLCSLPAWRLHRKMPFIHSFAGSLSGFCVFHPVKISWSLFTSLLLYYSLFSQFLSSFCLLSLFWSVISQAQSLGKSAPQS